MAQDPLKMDQLQIEPGAAGDRRIDRDPATGALRFQDAETSAITLRQMAGIRNIANVLIVGRSGAGSQYTTIQSALDDVPNASSPDNPHLIFVLSGVYEETVNVIKDGISLVGIGRPMLRDPLDGTPNGVGNDHTLIVSAQMGTVPESFSIEGFDIRNAHDNKACIRIVEGGAGSTVGNVGITIRNCVLNSTGPGGGRPLWVTAVNTVEVAECNLMGTVAAQTVVQEAAKFSLRDSRCTTQVTLRWDAVNAQPANAAEKYTIENCWNLGSETALIPAVSIDLDGGQIAALSGCSVSPAQRVQISGDQQVEFRQCSLGILSVLETPTVELFSSDFVGTLGANATAALDGTQYGTAAFVAAASLAITFDVPQSDTAYRVDYELDGRPANDEVLWTSNKLATGFTINFNTAQTLNVGWRTMRT